MSHALRKLDVSVLAQRMRLSHDELRAAASGARPMTAAEQRALGEAVLALASSDGRLRARAAALLGQVRASEEFRTGATERHLVGTPPRPYWGF